MLSASTMFTVLGFACQLKATYDAYQISASQTKKIESKFQQLFAQYLKLKQTTEKRLQLADQAFVDTNIPLFQTCVRNAEFDINLLGDELKSLETQLQLITDEIPAFPKIFTTLTLLANMFIGYYNWLVIDKLTLGSFACMKVIFVNVIIIFVNVMGICAVYLVNNTRCLNHKLKIIKSESESIRISIKSKLDLLKNRNI